MSDPAPLARIANAASRRSLLALLGAQLAAADHAKEESSAGKRWDLSNDVWTETKKDSSGLDATAVPNEQDSQIAKAIGSGQRGFEDDSTLRKQLLGPTSKPKHSGAQHRTKNGKLDGYNPRTKVKKQNDEISSEEEQGRSGLGKSLKHSTNKLERPKRKVKVEIETFESMQSRETPSKDDGAVSNKEAEPVVELPPKKSSSRPKSYLDEVLEANRNKQQKKRAKK